MHELRRTAAPVVAILVLVAAGCSSRDERSGSSTTVTTTAPEETTASTTAVDATTTTVTADEPAPDGGTPLPADREVDALAFFLAADDDIGCAISLELVRCDVRDPEWDPPPRPSGCTEDWGQGVELGPRDEPVFVCAGDTAFSQEPALPDGSSIRAGVFRCSADGDAVTCRADGSGHGFTLSRADYELF